MTAKLDLGCAGFSSMLVARPLASDAPTPSRFGSHPRTASGRAGRAGWPFEEGDARQPQSNVDKRRAGHPLTDDDRWPWLEKVAEWVEERLDGGKNGLITCSALKRSYRDMVNRRGSGVVFVFLSGSKDSLGSRLGVRPWPFLPPCPPDCLFPDPTAPP